MIVMAKKKQEENLQTKYIQLQLLKQQFSAFVEEKQRIDEKAGELNTTIDALHKLDDIEKGGEIWSTLGSGSFVRSDIKDTENVLVAIGAGVVAREKRERAIEILQSRLEELTKLNNDVMTEITRFAQAIAQLEAEVEKLAEKHEKQED
jgi:prefoldin alpha subunit